VLEFCWDERAQKARMSLPVGNNSLSILVESIVFQKTTTANMIFDILEISKRDRKNGNGINEMSGVFNPRTRI
jgi:hypothetical protein